VSSGNTEFVNIGPKEIRKRRLIGVVMIAAGALSAVIFSYAGATRTWYFGLFLPIWMGTLALCQARKKT
jgi:hypothetical protein